MVREGMEILETAQQLAYPAARMGVRKPRGNHPPVYQYLGTMLVDAMLQPGLNCRIVIPSTREQDYHPV